MEEQRQRMDPEQWRQFQQDALIASMHQPVEIPEPNTPEQDAADASMNGHPNHQHPPADGAQWPPIQYTHDSAPTAERPTSVPGGAQQTYTRITELEGPPPFMLAEFLRGILLGIAAGVAVGALIAYLARGGFTDFGTTGNED